MIKSQFNTIFIATLMVVSYISDSEAVKPRPSLGVVMPQLSGWASSTTPTPEVTTGWPAAGWGWETTLPPGWTASPIPADIELLGESTVFGEGESGATHGSQTIVTGDASNPAVVQIQSGSYSSLGQGSGILQNTATSGAGDSSSFQGVDGYNFGDAGEYYGGTLSGNNVNSLNGGGSFVIGQGQIGQGGFTQNNVAPVPVPVGWGGRK